MRKEALFGGGISTIVLVWTPGPVIPVFSIQPVADGCTWIRKEEDWKNNETLEGGMGDTQSAMSRREKSLQKKQTYGAPVLSHLPSPLSPHPKNIPFFRL